MKPNFALTLSFDGIGLLHRVPGGWHLVDQVALDAPDLARQLAALRRRAIDLDSAGLRSKLVIPNEQIRYLILPAPPRGTDLAAHVTAALDGATPYAVADLRFDWITVGPDLHVAAVARETLDEAEAFATDHGFAPVSFVAQPPADGFPGEPFFGPTTLAPDLIPAGTRLMRDTDPIRLVGSAGASIPAPASATPEAPATTDSATTDSASADAVTTDATTADAATDTPLAETPAQATPPLASASDSAPQATAPAETAPTQTAPTQTAPAETQPTATAPAETAPEDSVSENATENATDDTPENTTDKAAHAAPGVLPTFSSRRQPAPEADAPTIVAAPAAADQPPGTATAPRLRLADPRSLASDTAADTASNTAAESAADSTADSTGAAPLPSPAAVPTGPAPALAAARRSPAPAQAAPADAAPLRPAAFRAAPDITPDNTSDDTGAKGAMAALLARLSGTPDPGATPDGPPARTAETERQRMTIFGARKPATVGGSPRAMALILSGLLLIVLAAVAAWSAVFTDAGLRGLFAPQAAAPQITAPQAASPQTDSPQTDSPQDAAPLSPTLAMLPETSADDPALPALTPPLDLPAADAALPAPAPQEAPAADTAASYAATGIWQVAPDQPAAPPAETLDQLYIASIDNRTGNLDAVALPALSRVPDLPPPAQSSPAAPGTTFDFDPRGLVIATPEGAVTPDGVIVFAGRPAITPEGRPVRFETTPDPEAEAAAIVATQAIAAVRPQARPDTLTETMERAQLGGMTRDELSNLRPRQRPETLAAVAIALQGARAPLTGPDDGAEAEEEADAETASALAIASSLKPLARPRDFAASVAIPRNAPQAALQQAAPQQVASAATLAPQRNAAPQIPSSASVAQQATVRNAINLRQVNLIGVYGQPSNRRALVRLSNGRYQKVQVGDRLDGGQVRAIGENELSYVKGNRAIVLSMPQG